MASDKRYRPHIEVGIRVVVRQTKGIIVKTYGGRRVYKTSDIKLI